MGILERVTVTLPNEVVREIDRLEKNRSEFIAEAVRKELKHRRRLELRESLENPHPESIELAKQGLEEWASELPDEDIGSFVDLKAGKPVRWSPTKGWIAGKA